MKLKNKFDHDLIQFGTGFTLEKMYSDGSENTVFLQGDETFTCACPYCNNEIRLEFDEFFEAVRAGDIWGMNLWHKECLDESKNDSEWQRMLREAEEGAK